MTEGTAIKTDSSKTLGKGQHRAERAFAQLDRYVAWASALLLFSVLHQRVWYDKA
jgi:hypothetical protein